MDGFVELVHAVEHLQGIRFIILERLKVLGTVWVCTHSLIGMYLAVYRPEPFPPQEHELSELRNARAEHDDLRIPFSKMLCDDFAYTSCFCKRTAKLLIFFLESLHHSLIL